MVARDRPPGSLSGATWLAISTALGGVLVAGLAPVTGQRADATGRRKRSLAIWTALVIASTLGLFFVRDEWSYLWLGLVLLAAGGVFMEFALVSYNAMLQQVSTPGTIGKISGIGWATGYVGGIVVLLLAYVLFIAPDVGLFGVSDAGGLRYRVLALVVAVWFAAWAIPIMIVVPESRPNPDLAQVGFWESYRVLWHDVRALFRVDRDAVWFLIASAIYRDGLAAVFTFGAVLAVSVYGLSPGGVIVFGVAANVVAAAGAFAGGVVEDRIGPKAVIMTSLIGSRHHRHHPALLLRTHDVLDLRVAADALGRTSSGQLPGLPRPTGAGGPGGSDVRAVRHDGSGGELPGAGPLRRLHRGLRHRPGRHRRDRPGPRGRGQLPSAG